MFRSGGLAATDVVEVDDQGGGWPRDRLRVYQWRPADGDHRFRQGDDARHGLQAESAVMAKRARSTTEADQRLVEADPRSLTAEQRRERRRAQNRLAYRRRLERMTEAEREEFTKRKTSEVMGRYHALDPQAKKKRNRRAYLKVKKRVTEGSEADRRLAAEKRREIFRRWYYKNHEANVRRQKERREQQPEDAKRRRLDAARESEAKRRAQRSEAERKAVVRYQTEYNRKRAERDPAFKMMNVVRVRLNQAIRRRGVTRPKERTEKLLGCSWAEFLKHIERQMQPGMTWDNWGRDSWHIDHVVPLAAFDLSIEAECVVACNFRNHRPIPASHNLRKSAVMPDQKTVDPILRRMLLDLDRDFFKRLTYRRRTDA